MANDNKQTTQQPSPQQQTHNPEQQGQNTRSKGPSGSPIKRGK